jgi:hypothetical protein
LYRSSKKSSSTSNSSDSHTVLHTLWVRTGRIFSLVFFKLRLDQSDVAAFYAPIWLFLLKPT